MLRTKVEMKAEYLFLSYFTVMSIGISNLTKYLHFYYSSGPNEFRLILFNCAEYNIYCPVNQ